MTITISRQFGSGGREVGRLLAERLKLRFLDREIIETVARQLQVPADWVEEKDEAVENWRERLRNFLAFGLPDSAVFPPAVERGLEPLTGETTLRLTREVIQQAAAMGDAVIVGRGAQVLLAGRPDTVHIFVHAPRAGRLERIKQVRKLEHFDERRLTQQLVDEMDHKRADYLRVFYGRDWRDPELYDFMINTGRTGVDGAVDLIEWWIGRFAAARAA